MRLPGVVMTNNSRAGCADYAAWLGLPPGRIILTPNLFDMRTWESPTEERVAALRQELGLPANGPVLGGLFRFARIKDPELWVSAAARACADNPSLHAVAGGNGPERDALRSLIAASPFAERILFPGEIRDVPAFMSLCSVFLHTAHVEGLPNVLLEAQACEVPVVTTRCGGAVDVVEHGRSGFVVDERDDLALARHVAYLLKRPEWAKTAGRKGRELVARNFSPERSMDLLGRAYEELCAG
jgi:glycosyltransferase involved in cell wall biosynthesis